MIVQEESQLSTFKIPTLVDTLFRNGNVQIPSKQQRIVGWIKAEEHKTCVMQKFKRALGSWAPESDKMQQREWHIHKRRSRITYHSAKPVGRRSQALASRPAALTYAIAQVISVSLFGQWKSEKLIIGSNYESPNKMNWSYGPFSEVFESAKTRSSLISVMIVSIS